MQYEDFSIRILPRTSGVHPVHVSCLGAAETSDLVLSFDPAEADPSSRTAQAGRGRSRSGIGIVSVSSSTRSVGP